MQKKLLILLAIIVCTGAIVWFLGFFPVARVNDEFLWYRAYNERADALLLFDSKSRAAAKNTAPNEADESEIKRTVLQGLIMEEVFQQYIGEHTALSGLREAAQGVVGSTLKEAMATLKRAGATGPGQSGGGRRSETPRGLFP